MNEGEIRHRGGSEQVQCLKQTKELSSVSTLGSHGRKNLNFYLALPIHLFGSAAVVTPSSFLLLLLLLAPPDGVTHALSPILYSTLPFANLPSLSAMNRRRHDLLYPRLVPRSRPLRLAESSGMTNDVGQAGSLV